MNIEEANKQLEQLDNEYEYWLNEKEAIQRLVRPQATDMTKERTSGGSRVDKMLLYAETLDEKKINETLDFITLKRNNLLRWLTNELEILKKYGEVESVIIYLKENKKIKDKNTGKWRNITWQEIADEVHWSVSFCRGVYRNYKKIRSID